MGELVVCGFYEDDWDTGFVLGAIYNHKDKPPVEDKDKLVIKFKDNTFIEYDRKNNKLTIFVQGDINITAIGHIVIQGARIDLNP